MDMNELTDFAWNAIVGGVVGNGVYDSLKELLGSVFFGKLSSNAEKGEQDQFEQVLMNILHNDEMREELSNLAANASRSDKRVTITTGKITADKVVIGNNNTITMN